MISLLTNCAVGAANTDGTEAPPKPEGTTHRVVSLAPSNTELIYSIGAEDSLVAVSTYCDYPPQARSKEKAGSFVSVNLERMARLKPESVLLVNGQESLASKLNHQHFRTLFLPNNKLSEIAENLRTLGNLTGRSARANILASECERSLTELSRLVKSAHSRPRVFYCVWPEPLLTAGGGSFLNDVITAAGGTNMAAGLKAAYPHYSMERLIVTQPDIIIMPYEATEQLFLRKAPWTSLKAVREKRVYFLPAPSQDNLSRPTLRILDGLHWLATRLHPELAEKLDEWNKQRRPRQQAKLHGKSSVSQAKL